MTKNEIAALFKQATDDTPEGIEATLTLADILFHGTEGEPDIDAAIAFWKTLAESPAPNTTAQKRLARHYFNTGDEENAVIWWGRANPDPEAQCGIGECYYNGQGGLPKNNLVAMDWHQKAAAQEHLPAYLALAQAYLDGRSIEGEVFPGDEETAAGWLLKARNEIDSFDWESYASGFERLPGQTLQETAAQKREEALARINTLCAHPAITAAATYSDTVRSLLEGNEGTRAENILVPSCEA